MQPLQKDATALVLIKWKSAKISTPFFKSCLDPYLFHACVNIHHPILKYAHPVRRSKVIGWKE